MRSIFVLLCASSLSAQSQWTPEISMKLQKIADVTPSPDGKMAVWTETRNLVETEKSETLTHIFLWRGAASIQLTRGDKSAQDPAFSPDSRHVYFTSNRSGKKNLYRIPVDGGEAQILTDWKGALGKFRVSPDGKWLAFAGAEPDMDDEKAKKEKRDVKVVDEKLENHAIWIAATSGDRKARRAFTAAFHVADFRWSPDSRRIAFEHRTSPGFDESRRSDLSEVEVESGVVRTLASTAATESSPHYSPDGRYLAFVQSDSRGSFLGGDRVALLDRSTGSTRVLATTPDESPQILAWSPDSSRLIVTEGKRTRNAIYAIPVDGPIATLYEPQQGLARPTAVEGGWAGAVVESLDQPAEAFLLQIASRKLVQVSSANRGLALPPLPKSQLVSWKAKDGMAIEGILTLPTSYEQGKRYPLVLLIHGGPSGVYNEAFIGSPGVHPIAAFASKGYIVLRANIRGSSAYGRKFVNANLNDWGGGDFHDLMAGVDSMIAKGIADPERLAVMGWSYGGYMTSWVISQTTRFKAAIIGAGISNLLSMWGTNDIPSYLEEYLDAPWKKPELYRNRSALSHVANVRTPTLFLHGEDDLRVPISQAYEYYHALKRLNVPTKMVAYPRMPHGPTEPKFQLDIMQRHLDWVEKYVP